MLRKSLVLAAALVTIAAPVAIAGNNADFNQATSEYTLENVDLPYLGVKRDNNPTTPTHWKTWTCPTWG